MADRAERHRMTLAEFLEWDDGSDTRYELVEGLVYAMTSPAEAHGAIAGALGSLIRSQLKRPCRVVHHGAIALPTNRDTCYEADIAVTCTPHERGRRVVVDPILVVEILSPSTARYDQGIKLADYMSIASIQEILLIASEVRRAVVYRRDGDRWSVFNYIGQATLELASVEARIDLADIYEGLDA